MRKTKYYGVNTVNYPEQNTVLCVQCSIQHTGVYWLQHTVVQRRFLFKQCTLDLPPNDPNLVPQDGVRL